MKHITLLCILLISLGSLSGFSFGQWLQINGPYEAGIVTATYVGIDGKLWVGLRSGALYCSLDSGRSFNYITALSGVTPWSILVDTHGCIFVGDANYVTHGGIVRSSDGGHSWSRVLSTGFVETIVVDSNRSILAGTRDAGLFRSTDDGTTWTHIDFGQSNNSVWPLGISPQGHIFASVGSTTYRYHIFRSTNNGSTWDTLAVPLTLHVGSFAFSPETSIVASFVSTIPADSSGFLVSTNNGSSWNRHNITRNYIYSGDAFPVIYDETVGCFMAAVSISTFANWTDILRSLDFGRTWNTIAHVGTRQSTHCRLSSNRRGKLYFGSEEGMKYSTDGGVTWIQSDSGFFAIGLSRLTLLPGRRIYAQASSGTTYRLTTNGAAWTRDSAFAGSFITSNVGNYFISNGRVHKSTDGGATWTTVLSMPYEIYGSHTTELTRLSVGDMFCGAVINFGIHVTPRSLILRSTNEGESWSTAYSTSPPGPSGTLAAVGNEVILAGGTNPSILRSTDAGATWAPCTNGIPAGAVVLVIRVRQDGTIFAGTASNGMLRSQDDGSSWSAINTGLPSSAVQSIVFNSAGVVFAGTSGGVYRSTDSGDHWFSLNSGLHDVSVSSLLCDSVDYLFAATNSSGVLRSPTPTTSVPDVQMDFPATDLLYTNFPNPFNPTTTLKFYLAEQGFVSLKIYDLLGRELTTIIADDVSPGWHTLDWDASRFVSGIYFCRMQTRMHSQIRKLVLLK